MLWTRIACCIQQKFLCLPRDFNIFLVPLCVHRDAVVPWYIVEEQQLYAIIVQYFGSLSFSIQK